jgi:hypothetical protein
MIRRVMPILIGMAVVFVAVSAHAQSGAAGDWEVTFETPQGPQTVTVSLKIDGAGPATKIRLHLLPCGANVASVASGSPRRSSSRMAESTAARLGCEPAAAIVAAQAAMVWGRSMRVLDKDRFSECHRC